MTGFLGDDAIFHTAINLNISNNTILISSGQTIAVNPLVITDNVPGSSVRTINQNSSTANGSVAGFEIATGVANAFGLFDINNGVANPVVQLNWGSGVTGGLTIGAVATYLNGIQVGAPTGGDKGAGTINVATNVFKNNVAYNNPDYVLEYEYTGKIVRFKNHEGARDYKGRLSLDDLEKFVKENWRLPRISDEPCGIFTMADIALEKIEELTLYIIELHKRIQELEELVL